MKCDSPMLTPPCPHRPLLLQTRSFDMDRAERTRRHAEARAAEAEARAARTAAQQAARVAARLAGGGTSASGGGGGGVSTSDTYLNTLQVAGGAAGAPMVVPRP